MNEHATLLRLAREAIESSLNGGDVVLPRDPWLRAPGAVFVTLRQLPDGALRGCVGSIEPRMPLGDAVVAAARAAACSDPRFTPLSPSDLTRVRLEISVLSALAPLPAADEAAACARLEPTRPGVVLRYGWRQGVLLPKVWDSIGDPAEFLRHLKVKAGLSPAFWSAAIQLDVFTCDEFAEWDDRPARLEAS
jgi:AmmeMemoRadiSam system protein A